MHWNYELESYPQPAHRQLAFAAIDAGATAVVGHHPHRVGGIEDYRGGLVAYSLGNWWLPQGVFFGGRLSYRVRDTRLELALELAPSGVHRCHWFAYEPSAHALQYLRSEAVGDSEWVRERTPFAGMDRDDYLHWFRENRRQRKGLPVYVDYRHRWRNRFRDGAVLLRHRLILGLSRSGLLSLARGKAK
jgi:poly-gamma-glutamate synthesis protein (capsule biosynthesis protein)